MVDIKRLPYLYLNRKVEVTMNHTICYGLVGIGQDLILVHNFKILETPRMGVNTLGARHSKILEPIVFFTE